MTTIPLSTFGYNAAFDEAQAAAEAAEASAVGVEGGALAAGAAVAGPVIVLLAVAAAGVVIGLKISDDNKKREAYTQQFVNDASKKYPHYNVVICHPSHTATPNEKTPGTYARHQHVELGMTVGTCGYDVYFAPKGKPFTFVNQGDGGFINWAFNGEFNRNGGTITAMQHA
jgi:hypothetical protein